MDQVLRSGPKARVMCGILCRCFTCRPRRGLVPSQGIGVSGGGVTLKDSGPLASHALGRVHAEATLLGGPSAKASVRFLSQTPLLGALRTALQSDSVLVLPPWPQVHKTTGDLCLGAPSVCTPPALTAFPWEEEVTEAASSSPRAVLFNRE